MSHTKIPRHLRNQGVLVRRQFKESVSVSKPESMTKPCRKVFVEVDRYTGRFYVPSHGGRRRRQVGSVGNTGIALDFAVILERIGHEIEILPIDPGDFDE